MDIKDYFFKIDSGMKEAAIYFSPNDNTVIDYDTLI